MRRRITASLARDQPGKLRLAIEADPGEQVALKTEIFGNRILFADHEDWSLAEIINAYRSRWQVEADFRQDPHVVSFSPMFHGTEQKIRLHVFRCVLALMVVRHQEGRKLALVVGRNWSHARRCDSQAVGLAASVPVLDEGAGSVAAEHRDGAERMHEGDRVTEETSPSGRLGHQGAYRDQARPRPG